MWVVCDKCDLRLPKRNGVGRGRVNGDVGVTSGYHKECIPIWWILTLVPRVMMHQTYSSKQILKTAKKSNGPKSHDMLKNAHHCCDSNPFGHNCVAVTPPTQAAGTACGAAILPLGEGGVWPPTPKPTP